MPENNNNHVFTIRYEIVICLLLVIATLVVYWQVRNYEFVAYDEIAYVVDNPNVQKGLTRESIVWSFKAIVAANWHPLTLLSHMLDIQLYGMAAGRHHMTNVLFHIMNSLLLFLIFWIMTGDLWQCGFIAALFALHPLHVESVAWVAERKDVLSTFFWLLTILTYIGYTKNHEIKIYFLTLIFFILGLMAKPMLVTLPFVLLLLDYWPLRRLRSRKELYEKIPFFVLVVALSAVTFLVQKRGGAVCTLNTYSIKMRVANALLSYARYLGKMFFPYKLAFFYPYPARFHAMQVAGVFLLLVSLSLYAIMTMRKHPYFTVGWLWYIGTLVPVIGLVQVGEQAMADRYTYVPLIGIFIALAWGVPELIKNGRRKKIALAAAATILILLFMIVSWRQTGSWKNSSALFEHALHVTDNNYVAHNGMGNVLKKKGKITEAIEHYTEAIRLKPANAIAHNNLGNALKKQGKIREAIEHYREALRINPDYASAYNNLGNAFKKQGKIEEAMEYYAEALRIDPEYALAYYNLGNLLRAQGRTNEAIEHYSNALRLDADFIEAYINMGVAFMDQGRIEEAIDYYTMGLQIEPDNALLHYNLGNAQARMGNFKKAIVSFQEALRIKPDYVEAEDKIRSLTMSLQ
ncbi:MAG: tetratricopeptide repeat protein [bacterium]